MLTSIFSFKTPKQLKIEEKEWIAAREIHEKRKSAGQASDIYRISQKSSNDLQHSFMVLGDDIYAVQSVEFVEADGTLSKKTRKDVTKQEKKQILQSTALGVGNFGMVLKLQNKDGKQLALKKVKLKSDQKKPSTDKENDLADLDSHEVIDWSRELKGYLIPLQNELMFNLIAKKALDGVILPKKNSIYMVMPLYGESSSKLYSELVSSLMSEPINYKKDVAELIDWFENVVIEIKKTNEEYGIIHGDINPSNFLFDENKQLNLVDFGLSTMLPREQEKIQINGSVVHFSREFSTYSAPEVYRSYSMEQQARYSVKSDMYSVGKMLECALRDVHEDNKKLSSYKDLFNLVSDLTHINVDKRPKNWNKVLKSFRNVRDTLNTEDISFSTTDSAGVLSSRMTGLSFVSSSALLSGSRSDESNDSAAFSGSRSGDSDGSKGSYAVIAPVVGSYSKQLHPRENFGVVKVNRDPPEYLLYKILKEMQQDCVRTQGVFYDYKINILTLFPKFQRHTDCEKVLKKLLKEMDLVVLQQVTVLEKSTQITINALQKKVDATNKNLAKALEKALLNLDTKPARSRRSTF
jgi:serine/threonine protein kinase